MHINPKSKKRKRKKRVSISDVQLEELKSTFSMFDVDNDGTISKNELRMMMSRIGHNSGNETPCDNDISIIMNQIDFNNDGNIDFEEFMGLMGKFNKENMMEDAFELFDTEGTGKLDKDRMKEVLKNLLGEELNQEELDEMMNEMDKEKKGYVSFEDFKSMMLK